MSAESISVARHLTLAGKRGELPEPELAELLAQMAFATKVVAREIRRAALVGELGLTGERNPSGDAQKKLDVHANAVILDAFAETDLVAAIVSEELEQLKVLASLDRSAYILCVDPLDGSSNTDVNGAVGTIFGFYRRSRAGACEAVEEELRGGARLAAAGYVLYGPSALLVFSAGDEPVGFTLDHDLGEFLRSHRRVRCPDSGRYYSANLGNFHEWGAGARSFAEHLRERDPSSGRPYSLRYSGALVADLHRILLQGGIYFYPGAFGGPEGKLRLLYECAPLAFVVERAGGRASSGLERVLDLRPESLHEAIPFAAGSRAEVELYERFLAEAGERDEGA